MNHSDKISRRAATLRLAAMAGGAASLGALPSLAFAQSNYPERPITLIAPFGGAVDFLARQIALHMAKTMNGSMIVDVKLGGSGTIGLSAVARAAPDGYTIGMGTSTAMTSAPHLIKNPGYDVVKSFTYLGLIQTTRQVLVVSPALGVNTVAEFIALAKSKPGKLNFGSSGIGNSIHLAAEQFNADVGIQAVHVPYKTGLKPTPPSWLATCTTHGNRCRARSHCSRAVAPRAWRSRAIRAIPRCPMCPRSRKRATTCCCPTSSSAWWLRPTCPRPCWPS